MKHVYENLGSGFNLGIHKYRQRQFRSYKQIKQTIKNDT